MGPRAGIGVVKPSPTLEAPEDASTKEISDAICGSDYFAQDGGGKLYRYCDGVYKPDGAAHCKRRVKHLLERWKLSRKWSSHRAEEVIEYIRLDSPHLWEKPPVDVINVKNGLLKVGWQTMRELLPHTPDHLSSVQLAVAYDPQAECPATENFVSQIFPEDAAREVPWQLFALLMTPGPSMQKAVLLLGAGGNGKSTFLAQLTAFIGKANVTHVSLHKLESDKFSGSRLIGKLANICPDLPSEHLSGTSIFKAITGNDPISAEYKFRDSFDFAPFCRLVFSANTPPRSQDSSEGFFERWLVIPFDRGFRGTKEEIPRSVLDTKLNDPDELSGVLNKALDAFPAVAINGISETASMKEAWNEFRMATDHMAVWLDRSTIEFPNASTPKNALRVAYNAQRERDGLPTMTAKAIGSAVKKLRPKLDESQRTTHQGKVEWVYLGIALKAHDGDGKSLEGDDGRPRDSRDSRDLPFLSTAREG